MPNIIIRKWEHFNRSLPNWDTPKGKYIRSREHYEEELKKAGMKRVDTFGKTGDAPRKEYVLSDKARQIIESAKNSKDKEGRVKLSGRTIAAMQKIGAIRKKVPEYMKLPQHYQSGGFGD